MMADGQLRWRCRRGMKELDRAFLYVLDEVCPQRDAAFRQSFEALTEIQDPDIMAMLVGRMNPPPQFAELVDLMRNCGALVRNQP